MGRSFFARIDETFARELTNIKKQLEREGMEDITDRQASQVVAKHLKENPFNIKKLNGKKKYRFEIILT